MPLPEMPSSIPVRVKGPLRCEGPGRLAWGEDLESQARVAIRFVPLAANGEAAVQTLSQLPAHRTLPKIRQVGRAEPEAFAVLDFPQGRLLATTLERPMELGRLLRMAHDLSDALAAAHAQGIAHGELSANSVLLLPDDAALLWDLPLVFVDRLSDRRGEGRSLQKLTHTAEFLSPERAAGGPATAGSDVWSMAALWCRAAGAPRPDAPSTLGIVHLISTGAWTPKIPERLPLRVRGLLTRMLAAQASQRPSASEVHAALAGMLHGAQTLEELPAVALEPLQIPQSGEEGDLVGMLAPEPPRSALPDAHAVPTINDNLNAMAERAQRGVPTISAELEAAVVARVPAWAPGSGSIKGVGPVVPWTDPNVRAVPEASELPTRFAAEPPEAPASVPMPMPSPASAPPARPAVPQLPLPAKRVDPEVRSARTAPGTAREDEALAALVTKPSRWKWVAIGIAFALPLLAAAVWAFSDAPSTTPEKSAATAMQPTDPAKPIVKLQAPERVDPPASPSAAPAPEPRPRFVLESPPPTENTARKHANRSNRPSHAIEESKPQEPALEAKITPVEEPKQHEPELKTPAAALEVAPKGTTPPSELKRPKF